MRKTHKALAVFMAVLFGISVPFSSPIKATDADEVQQAQQQVEASKKKINQLKSQLASLNNDIATIRNVVAQLDAELNTITVHILNYNKQIGAKQVEIEGKLQEIEKKQLEIEAKAQDIVVTEQRIEKTENNLAAAEDKEQKQYEAMKKRIQYMYECGEQSFLDLIFSSKNMSEMLGRTEYITSITEYDRKQLEAYRESKNQITIFLNELVDEKAVLENQKNDLENQKTELERQKTELEGQKNALLVLKNGEEDQQELVNQALAVKQAALVSLAQKQNAVTGSLTAEQEDLRQKEAVAAQLKAAWEEEQRKLAQQGLNINEANRRKLEEIEASGGFYWPIPPYNTITQLFGNKGTHTGLDISGYGIYGKPIYAAYSGKVTVAENNDIPGRGYGKYVVIDHGSGVQTLYAHMSILNTRVGATVNKGDIIGYVGSTGMSTGAHLHIGLMIKGAFVDPKIYFRVP